MFLDCFKHYSSMTHKTPTRIPTVCQYFNPELPKHESNSPLPKTDQQTLLSSLTIIFSSKHSSTKASSLVSMQP